MKNNQQLSLGPAGDSLFKNCYRCDQSYDHLGKGGGCPYCHGCGECGCCPCKKSTCEWCSEEDTWKSERKMEGISLYEHYDNEFNKN